MFDWFKKKTTCLLATQSTASQPPGEVFPWHKGWKLTALDEAVLAVPAQILIDDEPIGAVTNADEEVKLNLPTRNRVKQWRSRTTSRTMQPDASGCLKWPESTSVRCVV